MIILGIDPGTHRMGFGVIEVVESKPKYLAAGTLTVEGLHANEILFSIKQQLESLFEVWRPEILSVEKIFFVKNQKTGIQVAQARGVVLAVAAGRGIKIEEFSPNEIKLSLTGVGNSDKKAVAKMVSLVLGGTPLGLIDDAYDALAAALTAAQKIRFSNRTSSVS